MRRCRLILPLVLVLLAGCGQPATEQITIGQVGALSGSDKARGQAARQGAALAVEELNAQQAGRHFTVLHADTHGEADAARAQADRLAAVNRVVLVLSGTEARNPDALAAQTGPHGVPLLAAAELLPSAGEYAFTAAASAAYQGQVLARFAAENLKAPSVVVLTDSTSPVSQAVSAAFVREFRKGTATIEERSFKSEDDLPGLVARVKAAAPTAVLVAGSARHLLLVRSRLHEAGVTAPLLLGGVEGAQAAVAERGPGAVVYLTTVYAADGLTPAGQEFARKYRERYSQDPDADAVLACDNLRLAAEAMKRARGTYGVRLRDELAKVEDFESLTGPFGFTADRSARRAVFVVGVEDGKVKTARRFDAEPK